MTSDKSKRSKSVYHGHLAERWVGLLMCLRGYRIIARRYRCAYGEVDLIVRRRRHLRFIEVKYRRDYRDDEIDRILPTPRSQTRIKKTALHFVSTQYYHQDMTIHLDCVIIGRFGRAQWFWDAIVN
jgi:putative endonuclease